MKNNRNNGAENNSSNNEGGMIIMMNGMITTLDGFAQAVRYALMEVYGGDCCIEVNSVKKNNGLKLTGLSIRNNKSNVAPNIYLESYYDAYRNGREFADICVEIAQVYEQTKMQTNFDVRNLIDFHKVKDRICFKLVNREKNQERLSQVPYVEYQDLAVVFYILVSKESRGAATITVSNDFMDMWGVDTETLYYLAKRNTQRMFRGSVTPIMEVLAELISEYADSLDEKIVDAFFDIRLCGQFMCPMYVATNDIKMYGATVLLYDGVLKTFAEKSGGDFYIIPSSVNEVLFVPADGGMDEEYILSMVKEINVTDVPEQDVLSDHIYLYHADKDFVEML